jgi:hypothetical protein
MNVSAIGESRISMRLEIIMEYETWRAITTTGSAPRDPWDDVAWLMLRNTSKTRDGMLNQEHEPLYFIHV